MNHLMAAHPVEWKLVSRNQDGSGVIEMPVLAASSIDRSLTAGGGDGRLEIGATQFEQFIANFQKYPGPVPVGTGDHVGYGERSGPQPGFVESLTHDGQHLWARIWLDAPLMAEVEAGHYRGFSVEFSAKGIKLPTADLEGHVLVGGIFTNRPAAPVHFKPPADLVAAGVAPDEVEVVSLSIRPEEPQPVKEPTMADQNKGLESLQADLDRAKSTVELRDNTITELQGKLEDKAAAIDAHESKIQQLATELTKAKAEVSTKNGELAGLEGRITELEAKLKRSEDRYDELSSEVKEREAKETAEAVKGLVERGVKATKKAALFDGWAKDPNAWLEAKFGTLDRFSAYIEMLEGAEISDKTDDEETVVSSGRKAPQDDTTVALSDDEKAVFERLGIPADFAGITDAGEAKKIADQLKQRSDSK